MKVPGMGSRWLLFLIFGSALAAQNPAPAQEKSGSPQFNVRVNVISIDAEVLDRSGNAVNDLTKDDFQVEEDGRPVAIANFARLQDRPVSLAVVLDTSAISLAKINIARQFIFQIIHLLGREDETCLITFDARDAYIEQRFTRERGPIISALENISVPSNASSGGIKEILRPAPRTGLGIDMGLESLQHASNGKKALLLISNRFRGLGPGTVDHVQNSGCTLLTLGFDNKAAVMVSLGGDEISRRQLMRESGGREFSAETEDIGRVSRAIAHSLKNYYALSFVAEVDKSRGRPIKIQVKIPKRPQLVVNARRSYILREESQGHD
jgi:VWFA-related protein